jgi:transcriptional regulator with XRE-family HTH domain
MSSDSPRRLALKEWRLSRAMTQIELAAAAGLQPSTLIDIERGKRLPRPSTLRKLATALGLEPVDLFKSRFE